MTWRRLVRLVLAASVTVAAALCSSAPGEAHKAITSKYLYNEDVFPLFKAKCARCHVDGGVAPMSLMTYDDAVPWAESLRLELTADTVPPHHRTSLSPAVLSARELDMILVWATGGSPRGNAEHAPPAVSLDNTWPSGTPDVVLAMPAPATLPPNSNEMTHEVVLPITGTGTRRVAAIDVLPGTPAMVRSATLLLRAGAAGTPKEVAVWMPGSPAALTLSPATALPAGSTLVARFSYKRTWKYEGQPMTDKSSVGLYFEGAAGARTTGALK